MLILEVIRMEQKTMIEIASIRLALIQPAFNGTYPDATKKQYYERISQTPVKLPHGVEVKYAYGTLACWESTYRKKGFDGLLPKERSDLGSSRKLDADTIAAILRIRCEFPKINATEIYHKLIADGIVGKCDVSLTTVQRYIKRHHLKGASAPGIKDRKAFEEEFACGMYQADTLYGPYLIEDGLRRRTYLIMILDDKSRMIVGGRFFYADNAYHFQKVLKDAVLSRGIPQKLYVDNGSPYKNEQLAMICGQLGTVLIHTPVRDGASKGKVERNFRTLRSRFLNVLDTTTLSGINELNRKLHEYINKHNTTIHSATGETPQARYMKDVEKIKIVSDKEWLNECFMNRIKRLVRNDATVSIDKVMYDVPMEFIRTKVEIRYLPDAMEKAYILYDEKKYEIRKTNKVENGKVKRTNHTYELSYGGRDV